MTTSTITIDRELATDLLEQWHEARCGEHGSNDQEHDVAAEVFELLYVALGQPEDTHEDH